MRIAITTVVRGAPLRVPSGRLHVLDTESGEPPVTTPLPESAFIERERNLWGGIRGGRGLAAHGDRLALALNDRVMVLDRGWRVTASATAPSLGNVHDLLADGDGVWLTCTTSDLLVRMDWQGRLHTRWSWMDDPALRRDLGHRRTPIDRRRDLRDPANRRHWHDVGHLNAIARDGDDLLLGLGQVRQMASQWWPLLRERALDRGGASVERIVAAWRATPLRRLGRRAGSGEQRTRPPGIDAMGRGPAAESAVLRVRPRKGGFEASIVLRRPGASHPRHNLARLGDLLVVNDSSAGIVVALDAAGDVVHAVRVPGDKPFNRGLLALGDGRYLVGAQRPARVVEVDLPAERVVRTLPLPEEPNESPYAICAVPVSFADAPRREHLAAVAG
jgi:hypothetical protein